MANRPHKRKILTRSFIAFMDNDLTTAAAAVSYFSMLVLFPALLLVITIGNSLLGPETVERYVMSQAMTFLPGAQAFVRNNLQSIANVSAGLIISCSIVVLWATSWVFTVIEKALNRVWGTSPRSFLHGRGVNIAVMALVLGLLGASALFTALVTGLQAAADNLPLRLAPELAAIAGLAWRAVFILASLALTIILFTVLYKILPNTHVSIMEALPGAVLAGTMWEGAKLGFAYLLPYFHYDLLYGSIGAGVAVLSWVYLSSNILLFGAQFTALLHRDHLFEASYKKGTGELQVEEVNS